MAGGRRHPFGQQPFAQHGIEKGRFTGVKFAHHYQHKEFLHLVGAGLEQRQICLRRMKARQQESQLLQHRPFPLQNRVLFLR